MDSTGRAGLEGTTSRMVLTPRHSSFWSMVIFISLRNRRDMYEVRKQGESAQYQDTKYLNIGIYGQVLKRCSNNYLHLPAVAGTLSSPRPPETVQLSWVLPGIGHWSDLHNSNHGPGKTRFLLLIHILFLKYLIVGFLLDSTGTLVNDVYMWIIGLARKIRFVTSI